ncbi:MAG TPA: SDR family NAD(P)-dependent oxidoreductase, partial [candidate division Zixibacteria bacterium]|nr:SDR family NAD(P)-dependent oxidoreductase [candidate division Zixibacteria bacterium]
MSDTPVTDRWSCAGARALVTGGTRGIGRAIVHELESLGARVVAVSRTLATGQANHVTGDIANARDRERIINESVQRLGGL